MTKKKSGSHNWAAQFISTGVGCETTQGIRKICAIKNPPRTGCARGGPVFFNLGVAKVIAHFGDPTSFA
jgi:hypothetical protein